MVAAVSQSFHAAVEHHRSGDLGRAEGLYREVLRRDPRHADAMHLMGVVAFQRNQNVTAMDYIGQAIDADRACPAYHNSLGNVFRALGRPFDAVDEYREALRLRPDFSEAYNNLGIVLADCHESAGAVACFERAVQLDPRNVQAWMNLGSSFSDLGRGRDAVGCFEGALEADSTYAPAHIRLGRCHARDGRMEEAVVAIQRGVALGGGSADVFKDLAAGLLQLGRSREAEDAYRRAIAESPHDPVLLLNLAQSLKDQKKLASAIEWYRRGIALDPNNASAHYALGRALHLHHQGADAITSYERCLALGSKDPQAAYHLGNAYKSIKKPAEAIEAYRKALAWKPEFAPALYQLGNAYRAQSDLDNARVCLEKVLERNPDDLDTLVSLGNVLKEQDNLAGAATAFRKVIGRLPDEPLWELWIATLCPMVFHSAVGVDQYRQKLLSDLQRVARKSVAISPEDITNRGCPPPYALQFHGRDDRPLKEAYARVFRGCCVGERPAPAGGRARIGFVVTDGHEGVFLRYLRGVLERLDREQFDPIVICSAGGQRRIRAEMPPETIETFVIPSRFDQIVERVRAGRFAVLYYWEVGSDVTNYFLPFFRLAPVQCTGAGVPVTTGLSQIDFFLSNDVCEPEHAQRHYTERLVRSSSLLTWQKRLALPQVPRVRGDFGVADDAHFYLCPHKIEKFHPDLDALFREILRRDPRGVLAIPKDRHGYIARKLHNRLRLTLADVVERIRFVPYQTLDGYLSLMNAADVLLDPIHYGGGLTSLDGFSFNKPIVTLPGEFLRGRYTFGFYRTMRVADCVASTHDEYVEIAVRLGTDRDWRTHVVTRIAEASGVLFEAGDAVGEYERIFRRLIAEAANRA